MAQIDKEDRTTSLHTRHGDISLILTQDNNSRQVLIDDALGADLSVFRITGYARDELQGTRFTNILPQRIRESVEEYVEYDLTGTDIHDVLKRTRDFAIIRKDGAVVPLSMRVQHGVMGDHPQIILVMGMSDAETNACIRELLEVKTTQTIDPATGLTDVSSFQKQAALVQGHIAGGNIVASIAVMHIDYATTLEAELGESGYNAALRESAARLKRSFRGSDVLAHLGEGWFAAILLKADKEQVQIPLHRLRNNLGQQPIRVSGASHSITFSIAYSEIERGDDIEVSVTNACSILEHSSGDTDQLIEI